MARDHAQLRLDIWADDDFRTLSGNAQHLYFLLLTSPQLSYCGVLDWRPAKLTGLVGDWTVDTVQAAAAELVDRLYIVIDEDTEEVLVRSFVRHDGLMKQPKMATAMATAHAAVGSVKLRGVVVWELQRLHREEPEIPGWRSEKASALLGKPSIDPSTYPCGNPSGNPFRKGSGNPSGNPSGKAPATPSPSPTPTPTSNEVSDPRKRGTRVPEDFTPSDDDRGKARQLGFTDADLDRITVEFIDYWRAIPGQKGIKLDWPATWRNRVRQVAEYRPPQRRLAVVSASGRGPGVKPWEL